jgi:hypothetical protein
MRLALIGFFAIFFILISCSKQKLLDLKSQPIGQNLQTIAVNAKYCTLPPNELAEKLKIIVVTDISGSNALGNNRNGFPTDLTGEHRFLSLINQLQQEEQEEKRYFTMMTFNCPGCPRGTGRDAEVIDGIPEGDDYPFTNQLPTFIQAVQGQLPPNDNGGTPIHHALVTVFNVIQQDAQKAKDAFEETGILDTSQYKVVFLSDGVLTDLPGDTFPAWKTQLEVDVNNIMELPRDDLYGPFVKAVTISTGFYYNEAAFVQTASDTLEFIAREGQGEFYIFNTSTGTIEWDKLLYVFSRRVKTEEIQTIVTNRNIAFDRGSHTQCRDSDTDGLCDSQELLLGSNPLEWDSDGNGIGDFTEQRKNSHGFPCQGIFYGRGCNPRDALFAEGCFENAGTPEYAGRILYFNGKELVTSDIIDTDYDGLSDCDEAVIGSDPLLWDSNNNKLMDRLAFFNDLTTVLEDDKGDPATDAQSADSDTDGISDLDEIKRGSHPKISDQQMPGLKTYKYDKTDSFDLLSGQTCFELNIDDLSVTSKEGNDVIEVIRIEAEDSDTGKLYMLRAVKPMTGGTVIFTEEDFLLLGPQSLFKDKD